MATIGDGTSVIVIGGGIAGASVAYALAVRGAGVTLVDDARTGQATAAGAGIIQPWSSTVDGPLYALQAAGAAHYPTLLDELADLGVADVSYRRTGALVVNASTDVLDDVEAQVRTRSTTAPDVGHVERVDSERATELWPPLAPDLTGLHIAGGARVDGRLLCAGLIDAIRRLGGTIVAGTATMHTTTSGRAGSVITVTVDDSMIHADAVVIAGGAWTPSTAASLGVRFGVEPQRGQITHLQLPGTDTSAWPSLSPRSNHYMVAFDAGRIVVGATRETGSGLDPRVTAAGQRHVLDNALAVAPGLRDATLVETRVGLRPLSIDGLPIIGRVGDHDSVFVATGYGPVGLTIAPYAGDQLAELILAGRSTTDLSPFAPR